MTAEHIIVTSGDVELAVPVAGNGNGGPLAICIHGFPDSPYTWRHLAPRLVGAGYRVATPSLRGYAPSTTSSAGQYERAALARDVIAVHEALDGDGDAVIVGHDWGAIAAYGAAALAPDRWSRIVGMAVPPGPALLQAMFTDRDQVKRSWYMFVFQVAFAEMIVSADDLAFVDMLWSDWSPGYDASDDLPRVKAALDGEHLTAALGYYRSALGTALPDPAFADDHAALGTPPPQPTLYLHGRDDGCVGIDVADSPAASEGQDVSAEIIDNAGHFLHLEQPTIVNDRIIDFLT